MTELVSNAGVVAIYLKQEMAQRNYEYSTMKNISNVQINHTFVVHCGRPRTYR